MPRSVTLTQVAIDLLNVAATRQPDEQVYFSEARGIWQPNTWLLQRCWRVLAEAGYTNEALSVADLMRRRQPLAPLQALHLLAQKLDEQPHLTPFVEEAFRSQSSTLLGGNKPRSANGATPDSTSDSTSDSTEEQLRIDRLLYLSATAAHLPDRTGAFIGLERLDQLSRAWDRVFVQPDMRLLLAETVARIGLHPLTSYLIDTAVRHFSDSGAQFLQQVASAIARQPHGELTPPQRRTLERCATALGNATLLTLHSRRIAAVVMARAGRFDDLIGQLNTIATIQEAHRETGHVHHAHGHRSTGTAYAVSTYTNASYTNPSSTSSGQAGSRAGGWRGAAPVEERRSGERGRFPNGQDGVLLRQVTRTRSDADVDFLVHTLQNAVDALPLAELSDPQRQQLSARITELSGRSDGWTAAGAVSALLKLGDIASAIGVANQILPQDPTRSEVLIALVEGLLRGGHTAIAMEQLNRAMGWAKSLPERTPERALTWGLAAALLEHGHPDVALQLLGEPPEPTWGERLGQLLRGQWPGTVVTDDLLRSDRLRLQAQLGASEPSPDVPPATDALVRRLCAWAPRLLDGETLVNFYTDGVLQPLLRAGKVRHAWGLLSPLQEALLALRGAKFAPHLARVLHLLAEPLNPDSPHYHAEHADAMRHLLEEFVVALWQAKAEHGIWQAVYAVDGSLAFLLRVEGPDALMAIAHAAATEGAVWTKE